MRIEQRVTNEAKSIGVAYLLWFFLGSFGAHRFYLHRPTSAILMLVLLIVGLLTVTVIVGAFLLVVLAIWVLVDAFLIPGMVQGHKSQVRGSTSSTQKRSRHGCRELVSRTD